MKTARFRQNPSLLAAGRCVRRCIPSAAAPAAHAPSPCVGRRPDSAAPAARRRLEGELDGATHLRVFAATGVVMELLL
jgi:hypothetical protein